MVLSRSMHAATEMKVHANYCAQFPETWTAVLVTFGIQ
jgi:hypothetical protein